MDVGRRDVGSRRGLRFLLSFSVAHLAASSGTAQRAADEWNEKRAEVLVECAQRHLEYGATLRKQGLTTQAAEQFLLAAEVARGHHPGVTTVVALMRRYDDKFWKKNAPKPTRARIDAYAKGARALEIENRKDRLRLAVLALQAGLGDEAHAEFESLLLSRDEPVEFDAAGRVSLDAGTIPGEPSARIRAETIEINGAFYLRDGFLKNLPAVKAISEVASEALRVRTDGDLATAREFHALGSALLPRLEEEIGARPRQRLGAFVFAERATYERYLDAAGLSTHRAVSGVGIGTTAVLTTEGLDETSAHALLLHELTHAFHAAVSPAVMPSWYAEGLAEAFAAPGTFEWRDGRLEEDPDGVEAHRRSVRAGGGPMPLRELLEVQAIDLWNRDPAAGLDFYAQAWALRRYLREGAAREISDRFRRWEEACRAGALGFAIGGGPGEGTSSGGLFLELFGADLPQIGAGFYAWLDAP